MTAPKPFAEKLKIAMKERGLKPKDLVSRSGLSAGAVYKALSSQREDPRLSTAVALAGALRVPLSYFSGRPDPATEAALAEYEASSHAKALEEDGAPLTEIERDWLRFQIESKWSGAGPKPAALAELVLFVRRNGWL